jgi:hypothetical protein
MRPHAGKQPVVEVVDSLAFEIRLARSRPHQGYHVLEQNAFAAAAWPYYDGGFAFFYRQRNIIQNDVIAKPFGEIFKDD